MIEGEFFKIGIYFCEIFFEQENLYIWSSMPFMRFFFNDHMILSKNFSSFWENFDVIFFEQVIFWFYCAIRLENFFNDHIILSENFSSFWENILICDIFERENLYIWILLRHSSWDFFLIWYWARIFQVLRKHSDLWYFLSERICIFGENSINRVSLCHWFVIYFFW